MNHYDNIKFLGALNHVEDKRDYKYIGMATSPYDWSQPYDIETVVGKIPSKDQNGSYSCGGQAWAYYTAVIKSVVASTTYKENSAKYIYAQTNAPGGGSDGRVNSELCKKGVADEELCVSYIEGYPPNESFMVRYQDITQAARDNATTDKAAFYGNVPADIDSIAAAVKNNYGCVIGISGENNGTWRTSYPKVGKEDWRHWLYVGKVRMIDGKKYIGVKNSWGDGVGENGWQWIGEDFFKKRMIWVVWTLSYKKEDFFVPPPVIENGIVKNWYERFVAMMKNLGLFQKGNNKST